MFLFLLYIAYKQYALIFPIKFLLLNDTKQNFENT